MDRKKVTGIMLFLIFAFSMEITTQLTKAYPFEAEFQEDLLMIADSVPYIETIYIKRWLDFGPGNSVFATIMINYTSGLSGIEEISIQDYVEKELESRSYIESVERSYIPTPYVIPGDLPPWPGFVIGSLIVQFGPLVEVNLHGVLGQNNWYSSDVWVTLLENGYYGVDKAYSFDNITWINYSTSFGIAKEGITNMYHRSADQAGNTQAGKLEIKIDKTAPTGSIVLNNNDSYATVTSAVITLGGEDAASGVAEMRFSCDNVSWTTWESYSLSKHWTLTPDDSVKTVYCQVRDNAGLVASFSDSIILDTTAPITSVISPLSDHEIESSTVPVAWVGLDVTSDIDYYEIKLDDASWSNVGTNTTLTFTGVGNGTHTIDIRAKDKAGNAKQIAVRFTVNRSTSTRPDYGEMALVISVAAIVCAVLVALYMLSKKSKS